MKLFFIFPLLFGLSREFEKRTIRFENGKELRVDVADSMLKRNQGLMNRTSMGTDEGMLFIFEAPQKLSFWMKDTFIPLSIAYLDENRVIKEIHHMKPQNMMERNQDLRGYPSLCECQFAIEVNQGWFDKNNIIVGQKFDYISGQNKKGPARAQPLPKSSIPK